MRNVFSVLDIALRYILLVCIIIGAANAQGAAAPAISIFVASDGDDKADGSGQTPLATLSAARQAIRDLKKNGKIPKGGVTVFVRGGLYELADAFRLTAEDSGTQDAPIIYRAYKKEKPVLTGTKAVSGFVQHQNGILKADVNSPEFKDYHFRQLFFDGKRQHLARYPNFDPANPYAGGYAYVDGPMPKPGSMYHNDPDDSAVMFRYRKRDARAWAHPELGEVNLFPRYNWMNDIVPIASVDREARVIHLTRGVRTSGTPAIRPHDRYYVRNLLEELDSPGEWYLDKATRTLYFWPDKPIAEQSVRVPVTDSLIKIDPGTSWITIQGFTLEGCDGTAIAVIDAKNCLVAGNTIHNTGGRLGVAAIDIKGGRSCGVVGNDISNVCNIGISLDGGDMHNLTPGKHYAENNYLHHIGILNGHGHGIRMRGVGLRAAHNLIHDITRSGISGGGPDCIVEYNHIRHVNLQTEDTGGFYNGGNWHIRGHVIRYNFIHDTLGYGRRGYQWASPYFSWGIYLDDDKSFTHVYGNIIARTSSGACHIHGGRNNVIENNIFIENRGPQIQYTGHEPNAPVVAAHLKEFAWNKKKPAYTAKYPDIAKANSETVWHMADNKTVRNIIYYRNPDAKLYNVRHAEVDDFGKNEVDSNLIWHFGASPKILLNGKFKRWEEWRNQGFDTNSSVADPMFVDPENDDYRLKPESPAFKLGFKPIPVEKIGPYKSDLRASWPIIEAEGVREHPLPIARIPLWPDMTPIGDGTHEATDAAITVFLPSKERSTGAAVVICPGGDYTHHALSREGTTVARWFSDHGIAGIVLEYHLPHGRPLVPSIDAKQAIRIVRTNAKRWHLDPKRIGIMGFSAGGHVASAVATRLPSGNPKETDQLNKINCRPDFLILLNPILTMASKAHPQTKNQLLGQTPPTFLVHAKNNTLIPVRNSQMLHKALKKHNVTVEYLELPNNNESIWEKSQKQLLKWMTSQ